MPIKIQIVQTSEQMVHCRPLNSLLNDSFTSFCLWIEHRIAKTDTVVGSEGNFFKHARSLVCKGGLQCCVAPRRKNTG